jgi:uncharacterized membrane protein YsdA (DUF1294 family)/cold shock CspA family protein
MRKEGSVIRWDDARGFGFIRSHSTVVDVYFHVRDFRGAMAERPRQGMPVTFEEVRGGGKGPRGVMVQAGGAGFAGRSQATASARSGRPARKLDDSAPGSGASAALPLMVAYWAVLAWGVWAHRLPWWVLPLSATLNVLTFFAYWQDKYAAAQGEWRTPENTLHVLSLAGGWWGAWIAHQVLRHKSRKLAFRETYWLTVIIHLSAIAAWLWWFAPH